MPPKLGSNLFIKAPILGVYRVWGVGEPVSRCVPWNDLEVTTPDMSKRARAPSGFDAHTNMKPQIPIQHPMKASSTTLANPVYKILWFDGNFIKTLYASQNSIEATGFDGKGGQDRSGYRWRGLHSKGFGS